MRNASMGNTAARRKAAAGTWKTREHVATAETGTTTAIMTMIAVKLTKGS
jgi:hypothetical protein